MSNDSTFEVRITQRMFNKGDQEIVRKEEYTEWSVADKAWCAYRDLIGIEGSGIVAADFIEHRKTVVHKSASRKKKNSATPHVEEIPLLDEEVALS